MKESNEQSSNNKKEELITNNRKIMYQKKKYSVLYEYQKLDKELVERETHNDEEQMLPRNPNNTNLSDETNDETVSR